MIELRVGDQVKMRMLGHYWLVENEGKHYTALYYRGKHIIVDSCKIKYKKVRGKYIRIRR